MVVADEAKPVVAPKTVTMEVSGNTVTNIPGKLPFVGVVLGSRRDSLALRVVVDLPGILDRRPGKENILLPRIVPPITSSSNTLFAITTTNVTNILTTLFVAGPALKNLAGTRPRTLGEFGVATANETDLNIKVVGTK